MVRSLHGVIDFFDIVPGILLGDILFKYRFIICLEYIWRTSVDVIEESASTFKKKNMKKAIFHKTIKDEDYKSDPTSIVNTSTRTACLLHSLVLTSGVIDFYINTNKTTFMFLNKK